MTQTLDLLGESVTSLDDGRRGDARATSRRHRRHRSQSGIERNISVKLTQLGLDVDKASADRQPAQDPRARRAGGILRPDRHGGFAVHRGHARTSSKRCGMQGYRQMGVVLQSDAVTAAKPIVQRINRARRARPARQRRVSRADDGGVSAQRRTSTPRTRGC